MLGGDRIYTAPRWVVEAALGWRLGEDVILGDSAAGGDGLERCDGGGGGTEQWSTRVLDHVHSEKPISRTV